MSKVLRDHLRDFIAVIGLVLVGLVSTWIIVQNERLRIPILEERPFQLKAELQTAQAVTPGQGQTVRVAGVRVGDIAKVEYEDGNAVVTMDIDREFLPIYRDATVLLRPKTGLKDMFLELDPGTVEAGEYGENDMIPVANTAPDTNLDQVLAALDTDTRGYLQMLLVGGGQGLSGRGQDLGEVLKSLGPINKGLARLNREVATRKENLANLIHNMNILFGRVGEDDEGIARLVDAGNSALGAIASQDLDVRRATGLLGPTLRETRFAFDETNKLADVLGPALNELRPFARKLKPVNESLGNLARSTTGDLKTKIRPFVQSARKPVRSLRPAAQNLANATPRLTAVGEKLNRLTNMAAYNPHGASGCPAIPCTEDGDPRDEGYLYWLGWLGHVGNSTFQSQDAHGVYRRLYLTLTCEAAGEILDGSALSPIITGFGQLFAPGAPCGPPGP
jgi:phospholipid/cholesterol/gamma-HCH transport system substrate-binding protein